MTRKGKKSRREYTVQELFNPQIDLKREAVGYGRQSTKDQVLKNVQSHISQTVMLLAYTKDLGFRDDGTTGKVTLFVENQVVDAEGNMSIKDASGTWPIDRRPGLRTICDLIESGKVGVVVAEFVDRLFRDEDRIDSNIFIKICKENDCYVHISSKRMTYNFANPSHAELFRMEVQMAAAYIENHIRGTMLRRRNMAAESGQWAGLGAVPVNFIVDKREDSPTKGKMIPYKPHVTVSKELYDRLIELAFDVEALCIELEGKEYIYPNFEEWVYKGDYTIRTGLKKAPGGKGYIITRRGLEYMLCNIANIGAIKRKEKIVYNHHDAIIDEARFWLVYDNLRITRPDGTPTGKPVSVRYTQQRNLRAALVTKPLLSPETNHESGAVYFVRSGLPHLIGNYNIAVRRGLVYDSLLCVNAEQLESAVISRMFTHLRTADLGDLKAARTQRTKRKIQRLGKIGRDLEVIEEELSNLRANLKKLTIDVVIKETEESMARVLNRKEELLHERERIRQSSDEEALRTLEEELADLEELWPHKPFELKKGILKLLVKRVVIDQMSTKFFRVLVEWRYKEWGTEQTYLAHSDGGRKEWTVEEVALLKAVFLEGKDTRDRFVIMRALPDRSWRAIYHMIANLGMNPGNGRGRGGGLRFKREQLEHNTLSWRDIQWLRESGLTYKSISSNEVGWSSPSSSK
jgi:DNA invertase Pin-like site-specific DNA recombinase